MPSKPAKAYADCPIHLPSREIRLVKILPRDHGEPVRCQFLTFPLERCPPYTALSYTWGKSDTYAHIHLGQTSIPVGKTKRVPVGIKKKLFFLLHGDKDLGQIRVPVGENLFRFLFYRSWDLARSQREHALYWIDALSIDQKNTTERNHQVNLMKDIYSNAKQVKIWLGKASPCAKRVIKFIKEYASRWRFFPSFRSDPAKEFHTCLCNHAYWSRAWIIQEIILAKKINICWGKDMFPWTSLDRIFNDLRAAKGRHDLIPILSSPATTIFGVKSKWEKPRPLIELLDTFRYQESSDNRDKIYAFLGLASEDLKVDGDYSKSLEEVRNDVLLKAHAAGHLRTKSDAEFYSRVLLAVSKKHFDETDVKDMLRYSAEPLKSVAKNTPS